MTTLDLQQAQAASEQRIQRLVANDHVGMANLLDEALIYVHSTGQLHRKTQLLDFLKQELHVLAFERQLLTAIEQGGLAFLAFTQVMHARPVHAPDASIQAQTYFTEVWRQVGGHWQLLYAQSTALARPPAD